MALRLTAALERASRRGEIRPQMILAIDGLGTYLSVGPITQYIRVGDDGLLVGGDAPGTSEPWVIGGFRVLENQKSLVCFEGSGSTIAQQLYRDKGSVSSIASIKVKLLDQNEYATQLISPGVLLEDILGRRATLWFGMQNTGFPEDFVEIFKGIIDEVDSGPGDVVINLAHPDQKKRQEIFTKLTAKLVGNLNNSATTIPTDLTAASDAIWSQPYGPDEATLDTTISYCVRIDDELIQFETLSSGDLTNCTRGAFGTTAASHDDDADIETVYVIEGSMIDLALKIMMSGQNGPYLESVPVESFNLTDGTLTVPDSIYFGNIDVMGADYGVRVGDFVTVTGSTGATNDRAAKEILEVHKFNGGSYIVIDPGTSLSDESASPAVVSFRSQYDSLGIGLSMDPRDVDIDEHLELDALELSAYSYRFFLNDQVNGKEFLEKQIYAPYGAYSLPKRARASVGFLGSPLASTQTRTLDRTNICNPQKIRLKRGLARNFYNTVVYKYDLDPLLDKYASGLVYTNEDSKNRIPVGSRPFVFESQGIRADLDAAINTDIVSRRVLLRYKFGAEMFENIEVFFGIGFSIEPGDLVIFDPENMNVSNTMDGTRQKESRFFEVENRSLNLHTGKVTLSLVDTNFDSGERYGRISPSSRIEAGAGVNFAVLKDSYGNAIAGSEYTKWEDYIGLPVRIHDENFTYDEEVTFDGFDPIDPNKMLFSPDLGVAPSEDYIIDIPLYPTSSDVRVNRAYKINHVHYGPEVEIASGASGTEFDVDSGDVSKFYVGAPIIVHNADFSDESDELEVEAIDGTTITVSGDMGFTPDSTYFASLLGFADGKPCYRWG